MAIDNATGNPTAGHNLPRSWLDRSAERWNAALHGIMALVTLATLSVLISRIRDGFVYDAVFLLGLLLMFSASATYHALPACSRWKQVFQKLDHLAIYVAIAGTYTPVAMSVIGGGWGLAICVLQWLLALSGLVFKSVTFRKSRFLLVLSVVHYVLMGWSIILFLPFLPVSLPGPLFLLMLAGGVCYSAGLVFFAGKHRYSHVIWHVFVNGGALCHLAALVWLR